MGYYNGVRSCCGSSYIPLGIKRLDGYQTPAKPIIQEVSGCGNQRPEELCSGAAVVFRNRHTKGFEGKGKVEVRHSQRSRYRRRR